MFTASALPAAEPPSRLLRCGQVLWVCLILLRIMVGCSPLRCAPADPAGEAGRIALTAEERAFLAGRKLRVGADSGRPPFEFVDEQGRYSGICAGYIQACARRLNVELVVVPGLSVAEALQRTQAGGIDLAPKVTPTPERAKHVLFTAPYVTYPSVILTRKDFRHVAGLEDLGGLRVGVLKGLVVEEVLRRDHPKLPLLPLPDVKEALLQLSTGQIDAFVDNLGTAAYNIDKLGITNLRIAARTPYNHDLAIAVRKDMPLLRSALDKALASLTEPERDAIEKQWLSITYQPGMDWKAVAPWGLGAALVLVAVLVWNRQLKHAVRERGRVQCELGEHARQMELQSRIRSQLAAFSSDLQRAGSFQELASVFLSRVAPLVGLAYGAFHVMDARKGLLEPVGSFGRTGDLQETRAFALGEGLLGQCAEDGKGLVVDNPEGLPFWITWGPGRIAPRQTLFLPLCRQKGVLGVATLAALQPFSEEQRRLLDELVPVLAQNLEILASHLETRRLLEQSQTHVAALAESERRLRLRQEELEEQKALLLAQRQELQQGRERLQVLSDAIRQSPSSLMITDREGVIEFVNPKFENMTGYLAREVVGKTPRLLKSGVHPEPLYRDLWGTILDGRDWHGELCNRRKSGELYWQRASISPVLNDEGEIVRFVSVHEDITERRHLDEAMQMQLEELERFTRLAVDREERMIALKQEINELMRAAGRPEKYVVVE